MKVNLEHHKVNVGYTHLRFEANFLRFLLCDCPCRLSSSQDSIGLAEQLSSGFEVLDSMAGSTALTCAQGSVHELDCGDTSAMNVAYRSMRKANSNILIRRSKSIRVFSNDLLSPSNSAIRAYCAAEKRVRKNDSARRTKVCNMTSTTHPHLSTLNLPLIPFAFISSPFRLQKVKDVREVEVLAI